MELLDSSEIFTGNRSRVLHKDGCCRQKRTTKQNKNTHPQTTLIEKSRLSLGKLPD